MWERQTNLHVLKNRFIKRPKKCKKMKETRIPGYLMTGVLACTSITLLNGCGESKTTEELPKPNIIYILADDLGYGDLSCYGQQTLSTPKIDQMAAEGMMFMRHYSGSTVCGPSRASLLTGKHTGNTSVRGNQPEQLLGDDEITFAHKLKEAGYVTGKIGKWGVGHPPPVDDPARKGFDYFYGYINMWHAHNYLSGISVP
jgi:arylsulfatase A-like enzyme